MIQKIREAEKEAVSRNSKIKKGKLSTVLSSELKEEMF